MEKRDLFLNIYIGLLILVIVLAIGSIIWLIGQTNSCSADPIRYFTDYIGKAGGECICSEGIIL